MAVTTRARKMILKLNKGFGKVKLGMTKEEVEEAYGAPEQIFEETYYYFENFLEVEFHKENETVCFIQINNEGDLSPMLKKDNLFELTDEQIIELFKGQDELYSKDSKYGELGYTYTFEKLQVHFWRECNPQELAEEMKGLNKKNPEEKQIISFYKGEIKKYSHFDTIAVFAKDYYD